MKVILIASLFVLSAQVQSAELLLKLRKGSGFTPVPMSQEIQVTTAGKIIAVSSRGNVVSKTLLGSLSAVSVQNLKNKIEEVSDNAPLVDLDPKAPRCSDAPSTTITVMKGDNEVTISAIMGCKKYAAEGSYVNELTKLAESLNFLSR